MWSSFSLSRHRLVHRALAICVKVLKDTILYRKAMMAVQWGYWSMWVGLLYTEVIRVLLSPGETRVSRKGMEPLSVGFSVLNCICGLMEFWRNYLLCSACWMTKVSFTYLSHRLCGLGAVLMTLDSNSSMNRLAIRGLMGNPWLHCEPVQYT